jgi:hypothetical protein
VQHEPYAIALVQADFDEMVACPECAEMRRGMRIARDLLMFCDNSFVSVFEQGPLCPIALRYFAPRPDVFAASVIGASMRHGRLDRTAQRVEVIGKV